MLDPKLAVNSIKFITRPSNISGGASVFSPESPYGNDDDDENSLIDHDMPKPSVLVEEFGTISSPKKDAQESQNVQKTAT